MIKESESFLSAETAERQYHQNGNNPYEHQDVSDGQYFDWLMGSDGNGFNLGYNAAVWLIRSLRVLVIVFILTVIWFWLTR